MALWSLIEVVRNPDTGHVDAAATAAFAALTAARGSEADVVLQAYGGGLHLNGRQLRPGIEVFTALQGLVSHLKARGIGDLLFDETVDADGLLAWARCWSSAPDGTDPELQLVHGGAVGVHVSRGASGPESAPPPRYAAAAEQVVDSRLRSIFLQHQLIAAVVSPGPVPPQVAKVVISAIVDRLLSLPEGLQPLLLLQREPALLQRSLSVAVLTVVLARVAGWAEAQLADLGVAGLLHDLGAALEADRPGASAFLWLLERGIDDCWLRAAVVARTWREAHGGSIAEVAAGNCGSAALVRLAAEIEQAMRPALPFAAVEPGLRTTARGGGYPAEFVDAAAMAFADLFA